MRTVTGEIDALAASINGMRLSLMHEIDKRREVERRSKELAIGKEAAELAVAIAREMVAAVRGEVQGVQVSAPFGKYIAAAQVLGLV